MEGAQAFKQVTCGLCALLQHCRSMLLLLLLLAVAAQCNKVRIGAARALPIRRPLDSPACLQSRRVRLDSRRPRAPVSLDPCAVPWLPRWRSPPRPCRRPQSSVACPAASQMATH